MDETQNYDYLEAVEVVRGVYWVGFYDEKANFHCNPYVLVDDQEVVVFDPGNIVDYPKVASKILSLIEPGQISYIVLHHQDPDLCSCVPMLEDIIDNKQLKIVTHSRASLLIRYYGVKSEFFHVDHQQYALTLKSGRTLKFMLTPFCHFPAAIVTYDEKEKLLFSSDLFAAISNEWHLFAREGYEKKMEPFHLGYMASNKHLRPIMEKFEKLDLRMILPQHGSIIQGEMISRCIAFLKELPCGLDLPITTAEDWYKWIPE